jgi:anti-sigma regulatory factor (Ser/Thr protein kinase)
MTVTASLGTTSLIALTLPSVESSVRAARHSIRAALVRYNLGNYVADAEVVASELATNAIKHAGAASFVLEVVELADSSMVAVVVTDCSLNPPVRHDLVEGGEHGRGLNIVEALSAEWGWQPEPSGKTVFAILAREA